MIDIEKLTNNSSNFENFKNGQIIIRDGETMCDKMYIMVEGTADVYKNYQKVGEIKIATLKKGDFFGEMSLFLNKARTATVVANGDVITLVIDHTETHEFFENNPDAKYSLIKTLCSRLERANLNIAEQIKSKDNAAIVVKTRRELRNILLCDLIYVNISGHWLNFHLTSGETVTIYASLKEYEEVLLEDPRFAHCHKSYIINMDYVEALEIRNVLMKNNDILPISKKYMNLKKRYSESVT